MDPVLTVPCRDCGAPVGEPCTFNSYGERKPTVPHGIRRTDAFADVADFNPTIERFIKERPDK